MKRVLGLYLPFLSTDRLRRSGSGSGACVSASLPVSAEPVPIASISSQGAVLRIMHGNRTACEAGLYPGQTLADAKAGLPELVTYEDDPPADRRQLEALAVWASCLSPTVHREGDDTLLVDISGCQRLFGGERNLLEYAIEGLYAQGFSTRGGLADTPGAAWAIAHAHPIPATIAEPGRSAMYLASLPVWSLRVDAKVTAALSQVGVETIEALLHLPRSSLAPRFGDDLLRRIDQALGDRPELLTPHRPEPLLKHRFDFGHLTDCCDVFAQAIRRALDPFCEKLAQKTAGVRQMFVTFYCPGAAPRPGPSIRTVTLEANLSQPTRSAAHLHSLLTVLLETLRLPAPADALMLWARHLDPLDVWQDELFATDSRHAAALGDLLDRLAIRLGCEAVVQPEPVSDHLPERAFRYVSLVEGNASKVRPRGRQQAGTDRPAARLGKAYGTSGVSRPLQLLPRPMKIATTGRVSGGALVSFRLDGIQHTVVGVSGRSVSRLAGGAERLWDVTTTA